MNTYNSLFEEYLEKLHKEDPYPDEFFGTNKDIARFFIQEFEDFLKSKNLDLKVFRF